MSGFGALSELGFSEIKAEDAEATTSNLNLLLASPNAELIVVLEIDPFQPDAT